MTFFQPGAMPTNLVNLLLTSLCNWNSGEEVLEIIGEALSQAIEVALPGKDSNAPRKVIINEELFLYHVLLQYCRILTDISMHIKYA